MKIYTKTGDKGTTRLVDGSCVEKFNPRVEAYGCVDELNSALGYSASLMIGHSTFTELKSQIEVIQNQLFSVGSLLATSDINVFNKLPQIADHHITQLEKWIDHYNQELPELRNFILPGGSLISSQLHICRTSCRRSERRSSEIYVQENQYQNVLIYLNRLSDLLFVWARWTNMKENQPEIIWKKENV